MNTVNHHLQLASAPAHFVYRKRTALWRFEPATLWIASRLLIGCLLGLEPGAKGDLVAPPASSPPIGVAPDHVTQPFAVIGQFYVDAVFALRAAALAKTGNAVDRPSVMREKRVITRTKNTINNTVMIDFCKSRRLLSPSETDTDTDTYIFEPDPLNGVAFHKLTSCDGGHWGGGSISSTHPRIHKSQYVCST